MLSPSTLKFLSDLTKNNNKAWFDNHRDQYDTAKFDFENFVQKVIDSHGKNDESIRELVAKKCTFRINRDIRFSKDKTPYKNNFGASIDRGGKKSIFAGYYFHLEPGKSFVGGGLWMPMPVEMKKVRQEIDYCFDEFKTIVESKKFIATYGGLYRGEDVLLKKNPQGFEADNPASGYLRLKSWLAMKPLTDPDVTSPGLVKNVTAALQVIQPLLAFINRSL
jgi:uncharacterized protein (TIGR02453 family)